MESRTVEPDDLDLSEYNVSDALREAVEEEIDFLEDREVKLVRMRADDEGDVFQITIHAGDEMYRMSEVAPGHVSRTVFRDPEKDGAVPYQEEAEEESEEDEETEKEGDGEEGADGEEDVSEEDEEEKEGETKEKDEEASEEPDEAGNESEVENEDSDEEDVEEKTKE